LTVWRVWRVWRCSLIHDYDVLGVSVLTSFPALYHVTNHVQVSNGTIPGPQKLLDPSSTKTGTESCETFLLDICTNVHFFYGILRCQQLARTILGVSNNLPRRNLDLSRCTLVSSILLERIEA